MPDTLWSRLVDVRSAFDDAVTTTVTIIAVTVLALAPVVIALIRRGPGMSEAMQREVRQRHRTWLVLAPLMLGPILIGPGCTILAIGLLSLLCYREFARATGFFRQRAMSAAVVVGILLIFFAAFDHWYGFFVALPSLMISFIAVVALVPDQPKGYIQRVAVGSLALLLFGVCFGHFAYIANDGHYRSLMILVLLSVELNDVFAYVAGKVAGRRRLAPRTSPGKTIAGSVGALVLTTALFTTVGHFVFEQMGSQLRQPLHLVTMGLLVSITGQFGDLVMSSVKRDLDVKDMGSLLPGHGGLLDRFDSLMLVSPAIFHYIGYVQGMGLDQPRRIFTGL